MTHWIFKHRKRSFLSTDKKWIDITMPSQKHAKRLINCVKLIQIIQIRQKQCWSKEKYHDVFCLFQKTFENLRNGEHRKLENQETKTIQKPGKYKKRTN